MSTGFLYLETGEIYRGRWHDIKNFAGEDSAGEVVFNTSHCGYEEIVTDPSYHSQIVVMTAPMQGNYGSRPQDSESRKIHAKGFISLEVQNSAINNSWVNRLLGSGVPVFDQIDTRSLVLRLRDKGTPWGALIKGEESDASIEKAKKLIQVAKGKPSDWVWEVSRKSNEILRGQKTNGPRIAVLDYGVKENIIREVLELSSEVKIYSSRSSILDIKSWEPNGILLTNGPGDPENVEGAVTTIKELLGWRPIFGICMGHQLLSQALGGKTYKLKFGHRGGNHPVKDYLQNEIYMTSQNHGYSVDDKSLPTGVKISHVNLYDGTVEGIECLSKKCMSVQFHPESHPGPRDAKGLFNVFMGGLK